MPSGEAASTNVIIFCLTQPCLVRMIYRTRGEHVYHYTTDALILSMLMQWNSQKPAPLKTKGLVLDVNLRPAVAAILDFRPA